MKGSSKPKQLPLRYLLSGIAAAILLASTVLVGIYLGNETNRRFQKIDEGWRAYTEEADRRGELLNRIRGSLGYGGIIHSFKNYVLRQDPEYLDQLIRQIAELENTINDYRDSGASVVELQHLDEIEGTIGRYESMIAVVSKAAAEGWPPERTDRLVKVDDTRAIAALNGLDRYWRNKRHETTRLIAEAEEEGKNLVRVGFWFLGGLAIVALTLYALFYSLQRKLRQTIELLSEELSERKAAEFEVKKFERAVDQSPATIVITGTDGAIEYVNRKFCDLTGYAPSEVLGNTPKMLQSGDTPPEAYSELRRRLARGEEWIGTFRNLKKNGAVYWSKTAILPLRDESGKITHFIGLGEDVSDRRKAREQMDRAQKMEAVGLLASGVAHDFNNVLTTILGNVHLALLDVPGDGELKEELEEIEIAAKRARNLVGQVLTFARRRPGEPTSIDVIAAIEEVSRLLRASILPNIDLRIEIRSQELWVHADPTRLHQVLMNLCSNAAEAIGAQGGEVVLTAEKNDDEQVALSVRDNGPGIPAEIQSKIFDPFYTTKQAGKGTGLGLSVVASLISEMKGNISVDSTTGEGTTFSVLLPSVDAPAETQVDVEKIEGGTGKLLLIDDEPEVLATCAKLLRHLGYDVAAFGDPQLALEEFEREAASFALVVTDFIMPGMNGHDVGLAVRALSPECPIIVCSAYQPETDGFESLEPVRILEKPIDPAQFARLVRTLIQLGSD